MSLPAEQSRTPSSTSPLPEPWIERLFNRLAAMYGAKFTDQWKGVDPAYMKQVWAEDLSGYAVDEIKRGLEACRTRTWPPTLPEFLQLCRPPIDPEAAYTEAVRQLRARENGEDKWSHPAIFWAACEVGQFDLLGSHYGAIKNRWGDALRKQLEKREWPPVPEKRIELPAPGKTAPAPEKVRAMLDELRQKMAMPREAA